MSVLDLLVVAALLLWAYLGWRRKFVREVFTLAGVVLAIILAGMFADRASLLLEFINNPATQFAVAFGMIFLVVYLLAQSVGERMGKALSFIPLPLLDRLLGAVAGTLEMVVFLGALGYAMTASGKGDLVQGAALWKSITGFVVGLLGFAMR